MCVNQVGKGGPRKGGPPPLPSPAKKEGPPAVIIRICAVIDRAAIVARAALGRGDRKAGPDNTGKSCGCGGATAAPIEPTAGAEVGGVAGRARRGQAFARSGGPGESERRLYRRQRHRRNCRYHGGAAVDRKHTFSREHLNVLRGNLPWQTY